MKKLLTLLAISSCVLGLSACTRIDTDHPTCDDSNNPSHPFTSTKIEDQYKLNFRMNLSYYDSTIWVYKTKKQLTSASYQIYHFWNYYKNMEGYDYGDYKDFDPFTKYDDTYFTNHVLFCGFRDLKPDGEIYFIGLDDTLTQDKTTDENGNEVDKGKPYYKMKFDDVYPTEPANPVSSIDYRVTFFFISIETDNPSYTYEKYTADPISYWYWTVYKDQYVICE